MEMDIYMRRRLVALGGLVAFFIIFVLLVKSCGGDDDPAPLETTAGPTGEDGAVPLTPQQFIAEADAICGPSNTQVGGLDPTDPDATREEFQITRDELAQLQQLQVDDNSRQLRRFFSSLQAVVDALQDKAAAIQAGDTVAEDEAQVAIDTAEVEARAAGEAYGFSECGQVLDAGQAPGEATTETDTGVVPPAETGGVAPPTETTPPAETTEPPADDTGGVPPADDTGGVAP
jgi:hypothetical protein